MTGVLVERSGGYAIIKDDYGTIHIVPEIDARMLGNRLAWDEWCGWDALTTEQLQEQYQVMGFGHGFCAAMRKRDGKMGSFDFIHMPRFYFNFKSI